MGNNNEVFKCSICGKFIGYEELDLYQVKVDYTPDTEYTTEETVFTHKKCISNEKSKR